MESLPKLVYTVKEACRILRVSRTTVWKLVQSKKLKAVRIGRRVLFTPKAIEEFLNP
jgi:excisionase family DNA binding protein